MKLSKALFVAFLSIVGLQKTFAQSADPLTYIPKQAQNVYILNTPSIIQKMDIQTLKELDFIKEALGKSQNKQSQAYLSNPAESGVNFMKPMAIVLSEIEGSTFQTMATIIPLSNAAKFNTMMAANPSKITQKGDLNIIESDTNVIAWNTQMFVAMGLKKKKDPMSAFAQNDSTVAAPELPKLDPSVYFQNSETNAKADALRELMRTPHDIYIYQTTDGAGKSMKGMIASMAFGLKPTDLDGNVTTGWADFENGRIYGESSQKMNEAMTQKFSTLRRPKPSVNWNEYINTADGKKPAFVMSFSLNPMGLKQILSESEMLKQGVEKAATKSNNKFSTEKILTAFGGDVFATASFGDKGMDFLIGLSVADKKTAEKMLVEEMKLKKVSKGLYVMEAKKPVTTEDGAAPAVAPKEKTKTFMLFKEGVVLIGKEAQITALNATPKLAALTETNDWQKSLKNKPMNLFFDFNSLATSLGPLAKGKLDNIPFESMSMSMFNKVTSFELKMLDKDKNALTSFFTFVDKMMKEKKEKEKLMQESQESEEKKN